MRSVRDFRPAFLVFAMIVLRAGVGTPARAGEASPSLDSVATTIERTRDLDPICPPRGPIDDPARERWLDPAWADESATAVAAGDLDGDGDLDLVIDGCLTGGATVVRRSGGAASSCPAVRLPGASWGIALELGDLDGDGDLDLARCASGGAGEASVVHILQNDGSGGFAVREQARRPCGISEMRLGDLDGDGDLDLLLVRPGTGRREEAGGLDLGAIEVLANRGDGAVAFLRSIDAGAYPRHLAAGDLDGDGDLDLAVSSPATWTASVLIQGPRGDFAATTLAAPRGPGAVVSLDADGDGDLDLVTPDAEPAGVSLLRNRGDGTFGSPEALSSGGMPILGVAAGDVDGDGRCDLVGTSSSRRLVILRGRGEGLGPPRVIPGASPGIGPGDPAVLTVTSARCQPGVVLALGLEEPTRAASPGDGPPRGERASTPALAAPGTHTLFISASLGPGLSAEPAPPAANWGGDETSPERDGPPAVDVCELPRDGPVSGQLVRIEASSGIGSSGRPRLVLMVLEPDGSVEDRGARAVRPPRAHGSTLPLLVLGAAIVSLGRLPRASARRWVLLGSILLFAASLL